MHSQLPRIVLLVSLLLPAEAVAQRVRRDWKQHPAIAVVAETPADLYAVGDIHGDYERAIKLLVAAKIVPKVPDHARQAQWAAGQAVLVCTGDLIDKGPHSLEVIHLFRALQAGAAKAGGRVIVTMGNHEATFLADPTSKKTIEFQSDLHDKGLKRKDVAAGTDAQGIGTFLNTLPLAARVGDWFFAHAGNTRGRSLPQLETELRETIDARGYDPDVVAPVQALLDDRLHPVVWWKQKRDDDAASVRRLRSNVWALGAKHLVLGHQPGPVDFPLGDKRPRGTLVQRYDGLIFLIDVGMSKVLDIDGPHRRGALLHVRDGRRASIVHADGRREPLWSSGP